MIIAHKQNQTNKRQKNNNKEKTTQIKTKTKPNKKNNKNNEQKSKNKTKTKKIYDTKFQYTLHHGIRTAKQTIKKVFILSVKYYLVYNIVAKHTPGFQNSSANTTVEAEVSVKPVK